MAAKKKVYIGLIISVVVFASICTTYLLDVDETTRDVVEYNYITDTTGLFDYDKSPQFYDYDLSENYTGYYTASSAPYWGISEGNYTLSQSVNRYPLNLAPTSTDRVIGVLSTAGLSNVNPPGSGTKPLVVDIYDGATHYGESKAQMVSVSSILSHYNITTFDKLTIVLDDGMAFGLQSDLVNIVNVFAGVNQYSVQYVSDPSVRPNWSIFGNTYETKQLYKSAIYDYTTDRMVVYTNDDFTGKSQYVSISDLCIVFHNSNNIWVPDPLGTTAIIEAIDLAEPKYLDITQGVRISTES